MLTPEMITELRGIERRHHGELHTKAVVDLAQNPSSALHKHPAFLGWDVKKAAERCWLEAARGIIRVYVGIVNDSGENKEMRMYVNIRESEELGYHSTEKVLLENRSAIVNVVADRILSAIHSYPLREFDPVVELVQEIQKAANGVKQAGIAELSIAKRGFAERSKAQQAERRGAQRSMARSSTAQRSAAEQAKRSLVKPSEV